MREVGDDVMKLARTWRVVCLLSLCFSFFFWVGWVISFWTHRQLNRFSTVIMLLKFCCVMLCRLTNKGVNSSFKRYFLFFVSYTLFSSKTKLFHINHSNKFETLRCFKSKIVFSFLFIFTSNLNSLSFAFHSVWNSFIHSFIHSFIEKHIQTLFSIFIKLHSHFSKQKQIHTITIVCDVLEQIKLNQIKSNQIKLNQIKFLHNYRKRKSSSQYLFILFVSIHIH
jgi:hypothetical protein